MVGWRRWRKKAIEQSASQIYGAERWLGSAMHVTRSDGSQGLALPPLSERRVHPVAVALGSKGQAPIELGDFGKGFVHVFRVHLDFIGSEEDLLAYYLHTHC